jgi:hypothetical protein
MNAYLRTRTLPWFVLAAVLGVVAIVVLNGTAEAVLFVVAVGVMLGASIRYVGLAIRDDPVRRDILSRDGLMGGTASGLSSMTADESSKRRRPKR